MGHGCPGLCAKDPQRSEECKGAVKRGCSACRNKHSIKWRKIDKSSAAMKPVQHPFTGTEDRQRKLTDKGVQANCLLVAQGLWLVNCKLEVPLTHAQVHTVSFSHTFSTHDHRPPATEACRFHRRGWWLR